MSEETIYGNEFQDFVPEVRERVMDLIFNKITPPREKKNRADEIFEMLEFLVPDEYKHIVIELNDLVLEDKTKSIERATLYLLKNSEKIKCSLVGL